MIFPIIALSTIKDSVSCRVPERLANELDFGRTSPIVVLLLEWLDDEVEGANNNSASKIHITWNGAISRAQSSAIEVPYFVDLNAPYARVTVIKGIEVASEVEMIPISEYDWEVISTQVEAVESLMLRQIAAVVIGENVCVRLTLSLSVTLRAISIKTNNRLDSSKPTTIAFVNASTRVLVAPPVPTLSPVFSSSEKTQSRILSGSSRAMMDPMASLLSNTIKVASAYDLRVLPQAYRGFDSSYLGGANTCSATRTRTGSGSTEAEARRCRDDNGEVEDETNGIFEPGSPSSSIYGCEGGNDEHHTRVEDDDQTCLVHPLFLLSASETASNSDEDAVSVFKRLTRGRDGRKCCLLCIIDIERPKEPNSNHNVDDNEDASAPRSRALASTLVVRLRLCTKTRPGSISLPASTRKALAIRDDESVRLRLIDTCTTPSMRPSVLLLRPLSWHATTLSPQIIASSSSSSLSASAVSVCEKVDGVDFRTKLGKQVVKVVHLQNVTF